jgi:predicted carbohydrate-binding protein with CBM5 and CBM33 domain
MLSTERCGGKQMLPIRKPTVLRSLAVAASALGLLAVFGVSPASAHGSVSDPPSRAYQCYQDWSADWQSPDMASEDPMCAQAWAANPNAMWNWNGQLQDGVGGAYQARIPDGTLCSNNNPMFAALNAPGPWRAVNKPASFTLNLLDQSSHGADFIRVYVTRQGFNPETQRLGWGDLEPAGEVTGVPTGTTTSVPVNAAGRSGHHIVFTLWQASHQDQVYAFCSDVNFTG